MTNLNYGIKDKPKKWYEWVVFSLQQLLSVFVATVLIAQICGTPISSCLLGACFGTLIYQVITRFKSPMFISSCGATVSATCGALAINATITYPDAASYKCIDGVEYAYDAFNNIIGTATPNYLMVFCGGLIILAIYAIFALIVKVFGINTINKIFPPAIVGSITMVIGLNLMGFIPGYVNSGSAINNWSIIVALISMFITAIVSHYGKKFLKQIPFLFGLIGGYLIALILTLTGVCKLIDFSAFNNMQWYPELVFLKWTTNDWSWINLLKTTIFFVPVALAAIMEHYSDHKTLSNIIGTDLTVEPGLDKTLLGDGVASAVGSAVCSLSNTSYGESIATTGFSRVASTYVITVAACMLGVMSFIAPITAFIQTIPSSVFGGLAMVLYGYIALSGLNTIKNGAGDLTHNKTMILISVILSIGVSGIWLFNEAFAGVALAMVVGVILNLILKDKKVDA